MMQRLAQAILRVRGWTLVGDIPEVKKAVFIAAPHTSNWDGFWLIVCKLACGIRLRFFAKHTLFWWPLGPVLAKLGAIPVERNAQGANVDRLVDLFAGHDELLLGIAPEGTRRWQPYWRTGFLRIARAANVPIVMTFIDYEKRRAGFGPQISASEDTTAVMAEIRAFYSGCGAAKPANKGPVVLKENDI